MVLAAIGLGVQALSGVGSFLQAGQRQKEIDKANAAAKKAVAEAKKQIEVKPYEALTVSDTPYEQQRERTAQQAAQVTEAAAEMGAAGMGRVGAIAMAANEAQAKIQAEKTQKLEGIELLKAGDELRVAKELGQLAKDEAAGAQKAEADAQAAKTAAITSGFGSLAGVGQQMASVNPITGEAMFELYGGKKNSSPMNNMSAQDSYNMAEKFQQNSKDYANNPAVMLPFMGLTN
jgi:colicin import membrane protein